MRMMDSLAAVIGSGLMESLMDQIRVESLVSERTLVLKDGTMMSMISLSGSYRSVGDHEYADMVERMRIVLSAYFTEPGHAIDVNFMRDQSAAKRYLERLVNRTQRAARNLSMDIDDVLLERVRNLSKVMVAETCIITAYSRPKVLSAEEIKDDVALLARRTREMPAMPGGQVPGKYMEALHARHESFVDAINTALGNAGQKSETLDVQEALQEIRAGLMPETYSNREEWTPVLPAWAHPELVANKEDMPLAMMPETPAQMAGSDLSHLAVPRFDVQLATVDSFVENSRVVRIGDMMFQSFDMTLAPEVLTDFNSLVSDLTEKSRETPWRASLRMEAGGLQAQKLKSALLSVMLWASPTHNRRIRDAIHLNHDIHGRDDTVVRMRMSFSTWAPADEYATLRRHSQALTGAVKRWGNCGVDGLSGDPMATALSVMPGMTTASTAPVASGPMRDIIAMMPLARQASPWDSGAVLFRTVSGKPWPYQPGSSKQSTWVTLLVGTPGSGKSVAMNAINFASAISPNAGGGDEAVLPKISIIDIGPSSSGLISMIQESLPAHRRHEVVFQKLRMDREFAINVFDTQLGMRRPLSSERTFLINFMTLICGDGEKPPTNAMRGLITATLDRVYEDYTDDKSPRRYTPDDVPIVDRALEESGIDPNDPMVWWDVVDALMAAGRLHEAEIAQRHAVPTLQDLVSAAHADQVTALYGNAVDSETGQSILASFQRMISEVVRDYPILSGATRYSVGSGRIVSMDLMDVTARGSGPSARKQTAIMYMLARQVMTRDYFIDESEVRAMIHRGHLPALYERHHVEAARKNIQIPKIICMDEFHRCGRIDAVTDQVLQDAREGRKFNIDIKIASQLMEDFPPQIIEVATSIIVCNAGSENSISYMDDMFRLTENEKRIMRYNLTGPSSRGAPVWVLFRTKEGQVRQELILTLGPAELWAFSTTAEDVALRARLYEQIGPKMARNALATRFPGGSAKGEIETRIARLEERGERLDDSGRGDIIAELAEELNRQAFALSRSEV